MKTKRKILSLILVLLISFISFTKFGIVVNATVEQNSFSTSTVTIDGNNYSCFVYSDETLLPSTLQLYWVDENNEVCHALFADGITVALSKKLGLAIKPSFLTTLVDFITSPILGINSMVNSLFSGSIVRVVKNDTVVGIAINDLSGKKLKGDNSYTKFTMPSQVTNYIYNTVNNYIEQNPETPPFINLPTITYATALENLNGNSVYYTQSYNGLQNGKDLDCFCWWYTRFPTTSTGHFTMSSFNNFGAYVAPDEYDFIYGNSESVYDSLCNELGLNLNNFSPTLVGLMSISPSNININLKGYFSKDATDVYPTKYVNSNGLNDTSSYPTVTLFKNEDGDGSLIPYSNKGFLTVYKNGNIPVLIKENVYAPNYYTTNNYRNYNTSNDNSVEITINNMNNANQDSNNVYNDVNTTTNNEITENNYNYNTTEIDNSQTTIINNYYYGDNGGGGDDGGDDDDDSIWDALLKAIADFFKKIGELLAAVLTGIIDVFTQMIEAAATITTGFTGLTNLFSSFFDWLPSEILAPIILGLTAMIFICLLKAFKG